MKNRFLIIIICVLIMTVGCSRQVSSTQSYQSTVTQPVIDGSQTEALLTATIVDTPASIETMEPSNHLPFDFSEELLIQPVLGTYQFTEGPVASPDGNVYFSDINSGRIYKWSPDGNVVIYIEGLNSPNGLAIDASGNLIICEGGNGRVISISTQGEVTIVADQYNGTRFNEPNDLWIDSQGGIYFTDPAYNSAVIQEGEDVYYVSPDRKTVVRVIDNLIKPNGIVGTSDGSKLYVADWGAGTTHAYQINPDGSLTNSEVVVNSGSDGLTLDESGNLYLTTEKMIKIYDSTGNLIKEVPTDENPTNIELVGPEKSILFITAHTAVYTVQLHKVAQESTQISTASSFILSSPEVTEGGVLPTEYTCDGVSSTLALNWSSAPEGTKSYALLMDHIASPTDIHWYWILYNIPAEITSLNKNTSAVGTLGTNSVNDRLEYAPPCSKGPGFKTYTYTVFALAADPQFSIPADQINREAFLSAIQGITLASAKLNVIYARP